MQARSARGSTSWYRQAISPDGRWIAASGGLQSFGSGVHVIDATTAQKRWQHDGADDTTVVFGRDGSAVAMTSRDGTLRTFDTASGREIFSVRHEQSGKALAFDDAGGSLIAASVTRTIAGATGVTIKRYLLHRDAVIAQACARVTRKLSATEWMKYVGTDVPYRASCGGGQ
jgi:WD40 repeat protein